MQLWIHIRVKQRNPKTVTCTKQQQGILKKWALCRLIDIFTGQILWIGNNLNACDANCSHMARYEILFCGYPHVTM